MVRHQKEGQQSLLFATPLQRPRHLKVSETGSSSPFEHFLKGTPQKEASLSSFFKKGLLDHSASGQSLHFEWPKFERLACFSRQAVLVDPLRLGWNRAPLRRSHFRRTPKRRCLSSPRPPIGKALGILALTMLCLFYYTTPSRMSPVIIFLDANLIWEGLKGFISLGYSAWDKIRQTNRNSLMHALIGNTTTPIILRLDSLVPTTPNQTQQAPDSLFHKVKLSREFLLSHRPKVSPPTPQKSPNPIQLIDIPAHRSGRRCGRYMGQGHKVHYHKPLRQFSGTRRLRPPLNSERTSQPTPPPRGTPGAVSTADKECLASSPTTPPPSLGRGTRVRRLARQRYRQWRQLLKGTILPTMPGNMLAREGMPLKAVKGFHRRKWRTAKVFKYFVDRKDRKGKQTTPPPQPIPTPQLPYGTKLRVGAQNVQSMAEQLKHQAVLHIIKERALDVLFLTETHATQYHQYKSQHHLFIVNGNNKDKYGGVTAIIPPRTLPFLKEVVQHGSRILQVTLSSSSGDVHFLGVYAPHNKHDLEIVKTPFWEHLENIIARLPRPEPVFIIGDFNVRLQGRRQDEVDYLGPHILGRGRNYISDEPGSNRRLLLDLLKGADLKDALSFKQPNLVKQVTYREKKTRHLAIGSNSQATL